VGEAPHYDHHFGPVLWFDKTGHTHVLFNCHGGPGTHVISAQPESIGEWREAPDVWRSISYPRVLHVYDGKLLLYYRVFGHMGYWTYLISDDGVSWAPPDSPLIDFDRDPQHDHDTWAGTYDSVCVGKDGRSLHIAFVYWDERRRVNPLYNCRLLTTNRYHLYYLRLDIPSGDLWTIDGKRMDVPVTRHQAEQCRIWDTGHRTTNMPSVLVDENDEPCFVMPVSEESVPWDCTFYFVRREGSEWMKEPIVKTNSTWAGCHLARGGADELIAYLVVGDIDGETLSYGGGQIEEWISTDGGASWQLSRQITPEPGFLYNNPRPVECYGGGELPGHLVFYGWQGPESIQPPKPPRVLDNRGKAYLWHDGQYL